MSGGHGARAMGRGPEAVHQPFCQGKPTGRSTPIDCFGRFLARASSPLKDMGRGAWDTGQRLNRPIAQRHLIALTAFWPEPPVLDRKSVV